MSQPTTLEEWHQAYRERYVNLAGFLADIADTREGHDALSNAVCLQRITDKLFEGLENGGLTVRECGGIRCHRMVAQKPGAAGKLCTACAEREKGRL